MFSAWLKALCNAVTSSARMHAPETMSCVLCNEAAKDDIKHAIDCPRFLEALPQPLAAGTRRLRQGLSGSATDRLGGIVVCFLLFKVIMKRREIRPPETICVKGFIRAILRDVSALPKFPAAVLECFLAAVRI